jgi:hypothetical protein
LTTPRAGFLPASGGLCKGGANSPRSATPPRPEPGTAHGPQNSPRIDKKKAFRGANAPLRRPSQPSFGPLTEDGRFQTIRALRSQRWASTRRRPRRRLDRQSR